MTITKMSVSGIARNNKSNQFSAPPFFYAGIETAKTGSFTDGGIDYDYWDFTSNGSLSVVSAGMIDVLVVGGGGNATSANGNSGGSGGGVRWGLVYAGPGTISIAIGAGSASNGGNGSQSSFGTLMKIGGGQSGFAMGVDTGSDARSGLGGGGSGAGSTRVSTANGGGAGGLVFGSNQHDGIFLNYNGSNLEFGKGGTNVAAAASRGHGTRDTSPSSNGRVIARIRKS